MRLALVEPSCTDREAVTRLLQGAGQQVSAFADGPEALEALKADTQFNAVITGDALASMSGLEFVWEARLLAGTHRFLHILFMSSLDGDDHISQALDCGADDFIGKPPSPRELHARLRAADRIAKLQAELSDLAFTDPLTGLRNRRGFFQEAVPLVAGSGKPLSGLLIDLDLLKDINDLYGHKTGDAAIKALAEILQQEDVLAGRLGGDEFGILLPGHDLRDAAAVGETLRARLGASPLEVADASLRLTCSIGIAQRVGNETVDELLAKADSGLYKAKHDGRDRVAAPPSAAWTRVHPRTRARVARTRGSRNKPALGPQKSLSAG